MNRRDLLLKTAATGALAAFPVGLRAAGHAQDVVEFAAGGQVVVHPVSHASVVLETTMGTIYVDPVGSPDAYSDLPPADLILVTHEHGDHFNADVLAAIGAGNVPMLSNPAVHGMLGEMPDSQAIGNGETADIAGFGIEAVPAYNITPERMRFHPKGRDNGYVISVNGARIYLSGDSEDSAEMRALQGIDLAFVSMNLPFTMDAEAAASAVREFRPRAVYPYHYRGRDGGTQDPAVFADLVGDASDVRLGDWY